MLLFLYNSVYLGDKRLTRFCVICFFFFFNDTATTEIYTLSLHDALPICDRDRRPGTGRGDVDRRLQSVHRSEEHTSELQSHHDLVCRLLLEKKKQRSSPLRVWKIKLRENTGLLQSVLPCSLELVSVDFISFGLSSAGLIFFFNDTATTEIYTLSLHDALPI